MNKHFLMRIEEAALNAWRAPREMMYDGWLVRFAGGKSKRVNSVNPLYPSTIPLAEKIKTCETIFAGQGQPCLFRLSDPFTQPDLPQALKSAGYTSFDPTFVLGREIQFHDEQPENVTILEMPVTDWFHLRDQFMRVPAADRFIHESIVLSIVPEMVLMGLFFDGKPAACGMGVVEGSLLGYFSIHTAKSWRRKGYGSLIMSALTDWGMARGATYGYLQVEGDNRPALSMYEKLGYERCYQYVYYRK